METYRNSTYVVSLFERGPSLYKTDHVNIKYPNCITKNNHIANWPIFKRKFLNQKKRKKDVDIKVYLNVSKQIYIEVT